MYHGQSPTLPILWQLGVVAKSDHNDYIDWDSQREGYVDNRSKYIPVVAIPKTQPKKKAEQGSLLGIRTEERLGSLMTAGGMAWLVYVATQDLNHIWKLNILDPGPVEICAVGILIWLHAKWRRSIAAN